MTEDEIQSGSELIAKFMGYKPCFSHITDKYGYTQTVDGFLITGKCNIGNHQEDEYENFAIEHLRFHSSWDWIMPVVDKICDYEVVGDFHICGSTILIISAIKCDDNPVSDIEIWHSGGDDKKRAIFEACVKFIKQIK